MPAVRTWRGGAGDPELLAARRGSSGAGTAARGRTTRTRPAPLSSTDQAFVYAVATLVLVGLIGVGTRAAGPWQADRAYGQALRAQYSLLAEGRSSGQRSSLLARRMFEQLRTARALNPWEPRYVMSDALGAVREASESPSGSALQHDSLARAHAAYRRVIRLDPGAPRFLLLYGDALLRLYERHPSLREAREEALVVLRQAHRVSPRDPDIAARLGAAERA